MLPGPRKRGPGKTVGKTLRVFPTKGLRSAARIICPSITDKFHTGSLRSIFSHAHVARENDFISLPPAGGKLCEAFLTRYPDPRKRGSGLFFGAGRTRGGERRPPLRKCILRCVGEGLCPSRGRGRTPPLRKRNKRCNGRATARVAPTEGLQEVRGERNPPVTALPCRPPLGKGAEEDGRKQRLFDTIKPPPGGGGFRRGICGEGDLRGGGVFSVGRFWNQSSVWAAATALEMICTSWAGSSFSGTSSSAKWR